MAWLLAILVCHARAEECATGCNPCRDTPNHDWYEKHWNHGNPSDHWSPDFVHFCGCCGGTLEQQDVCKVVCTEESRIRDAKSAFQHAAGALAALRHLGKGAFTLEDYLKQVSDVADSLVDFAGRIDMVLLDTELASMAGEGTGDGGMAIIAGTLLAYTNTSSGGHLRLTVPPDTTLTTKLIKTSHVDRASRQVRAQVEDKELGRQDQEVLTLLRELRLKMDRVQKHMRLKATRVELPAGSADWSRRTSEWARSIGTLAYKGRSVISGTQAADFAHKAAKFIADDLSERQTSAEARRLLSEVLEFGATAESVSRTLRAFGFGWDIDGSKNLEIPPTSVPWDPKGKKNPSNAYRDAARKLRYKVWAVDRIMVLLGEWSAAAQHYVIESCMHSSALDIQKGPHPHPSLASWPRHGMENQKFTYAPGGTIANPATGLVLDIRSGGRESGAELIMHTPHDGWNQQWVWTADGHIKNPETGLVIDIPEGSWAAGMRVYMWHKSIGENQKWSLRRV